MTLLLATILFASPAKPLNVLFLGNSHTSVNGLSATVVRFLESDGTGRKVKAQLISGPDLGHLWAQKRVQDTIKEGGWDVVVLQGQMISMSHKYDYSKTEAISLANLAKKSGAKALFFAEWPRANNDESDYIYNIYADIAKKSVAEVVPVCYAFDRSTRAKTKLSLLGPDGNHASPQGSYLGALTIYYWIAGTNARPSIHAEHGVTNEAAVTLQAIAKEVVEVSRKKAGKIPTAAQWRTSSGSTQGRQ